MRYVMFKEKGQWVIRRYLNGKNERHPLKQYRHIRDNEEALREYVMRLNKPHDTKVVVGFKHAFISTSLLDEYMRFLTTNLGAKAARQEFSYLRRHVLDFFIGRLNLIDPVDWHKCHKTEWSEYLQSKETPSSAKTKRDIVISANRFTEWLSEQRPNELKYLKFKPLTHRQYKRIEADRKRKGQVRTRGFIPDKDWEMIQAKLPEDLAPFVNLARYYGLRRAETLALEFTDITLGGLDVKRQLECIEKDVATKGLEDRKVPHWFATTETVYAWIEASKNHIMHPSTLTHRWNEYMDELKFDWDFHDLRHTFITKAIRQYPPRDVQLAAGHKDIRTTMGYSHDDRDLSDEVYIPPKAS